MCNFKNIYLRWLASTNKQIKLAILFLYIQFNAFAQSCPANIDFETGTFTGWTCYTGYVAAVGSDNVISLTPSGPINGRHEMMSAFPGNGSDFYGGFPVNCPNGSKHSIKLGNDTGGAEAEGVSYDFTIPANANLYNLIYHYAVVFQDPGHLEFQQPRMQIEITNVSDNQTITCSSFAFFPNGSPLPGFELSPNPGGPTPVWYKPWSAVSVNLNGLAGKKIRLFFKTADCTFRKHFGYGYVDVNSECSGKFEGASFCPNDTLVNVVAPYGYQSYTWYNNNFTQTLGSSQILTLTPPLPPASTVAVIIVPYDGYGCLDTLYTDIKNDLIVTANAGKDTVSCNHNPVPIGMQPTLGVNYHWLPAAGLSDANVANPLALPDVTTAYVLTAQSNGGGCLKTDTVIVKAALVSNSITILGKQNYCIGSGDSSVLVVEPADSIQWYRNNAPIVGANATNYKVTQSGNYFAVLFAANGCTLNTISQQINIATVPVASFTVNNPIQCLFGNQFILKNNSTNLIGAMQYQWILGDGNIDSTRDITYSYKKAGIYNVKLLVSSIGICTDSAMFTVTVNQNAVASFDALPTCINLPVQIKNNTSDTINSPINYLWSFGNGQTSTLQNPVAPVYSSAGNYDISLSVSSVQCPLPAHVIKKTITIDRPLPNKNYATAFAVINLPLVLHARNIGDSINWNPDVFLDDVNSFNPIFKGNTEQLFTIDITTKNGCVTTDTQLVKLVKQVEIFVPNAFTPNGDGLNDILKPVTFGIKQVNYFRVYNRWGNLIYQTQNAGEGWDGNFKNVKEEMQTVVWYFEGVGVDGNIYSQKGTTVLVR